jgi:transposase
MGKQKRIDIKETAKELDLLYRKTKNFKIKRRIKSLILTKSNKFKTREQLAKYLGIDVKTLYVWTKTYQDEGLTAMLIMSGGGKRREKVPDTIKSALEEKLNNSTSPLQGYTDAVEWVRNNFDININYHTLRSFMIVNFGTKLKQPRKSHYKKDEKALENFKKNSQNYKKI